MTTHSGKVQLCDGDYYYYDFDRESRKRTAGCKDKDELWRPGHFTAVQSKPAKPGHTRKKFDPGRNCIPGLCHLNGFVTGWRWVPGNPSIKGFMKIDKQRLEL
jgi:hypothetical protein